MKGQTFLPLILRQQVPLLLLLVLLVACQQSLPAEVVTETAAEQTVIGKLFDAVEGELSEADDVFEGRYADRYKLALSALEPDTEVTVIISSAEFAPYLYLLDAETGKILAESGRVEKGSLHSQSGGGGSALLSYRFDRSFYELIASSELKAVGRYRLFFCPHPQWVTANADSGPGSLREAVARVVPGGTICFDPDVFNETAPEAARTIGLESGIILDKDVWVQGPGSDAVMISGNGSTRVFTVGTDVTVTLSGLTIREGRAESGGGVLNYGNLNVRSSLITGNKARLGGGIDNASTLTVQDSTLANNTAEWSGNPYSAASGGGIYNSGNLTLHNSAVTGNVAAWNGGGIYNYYSTATVTTSTISGNSASRWGGGIASVRGTFTLQDSNVTGNTASTAGGIFNDAALTLQYSTIADNTASGGAGGGILNLPYGIISVRLEDSSITNNRAIGNGGGIANNGSDVHLTLLGSSSVTNNQADFDGDGIGRGGGIYGGSLNNVVPGAGGNVYNNAPDDIHP